MAQLRALSVVRILSLDNSMFLYLTILFVHL